MRKKRKGRIQRFEEQNRRNEDMQNLDRRKSADRKTKKKVRVNHSRLAMTVFLVVLVCVLGVSVGNIFSLRAEQKNLKEQNDALLLEKEALEEELENVSDKEYIEEQARIQLKLIKPGEILYILENDKDKEENKDENEKEN